MGSVWFKSGNKTESFGGRRSGWVRWGEVGPKTWVQTIGESPWTGSLGHEKSKKDKELNIKTFGEQIGGWGGGQASKPCQTNSEQENIHYEVWKKACLDKHMNQNIIFVIFYWKLAREPVMNDLKSVNLNPIWDKEISHLLLFFFKERSRQIKIIFRFEDAGNIGDQVKPLCFCHSKQQVVGTSSIISNHHHHRPSLPPLSPSS